MDLLFEWDDNKEKANIRKHGIDFETAASVFLDPWLIELYDERHSTFWEDRYQVIGMAGNRIAVLMVVYTERKGVIRLISARIATKEEEAMYYDR